MTLTPKLGSGLQQTTLAPGSDKTRGQGSQNFKQMDRTLDPFY